MKRIAVVLVAVVLAVMAWLLWGSGGGPSVDDMAGVYRFDPIPAIKRGSPRSEAQRMIETAELRLSPDGSYTFSMLGRDPERGRWEIDGSRVIIQDDSVPRRSGVWLIRGDILLCEAVEKVWRSTSTGEGFLGSVALRKQ